MRGDIELFEYQQRLKTLVDQYFDVLNERTLKESMFMIIDVIKHEKELRRENTTNEANNTI